MGRVWVISPQCRHFKEARWLMPTSTYFTDYKGQLRWRHLMSDEITPTLTLDITDSKPEVRRRTRDTDCSAPVWYVTLTEDLIRNLVSDCFLTSVYCVLWPTREESHHPLRYLLLYFCLTGMTAWISLAGARLWIKPCGSDYAIVQMHNNQWL